MALMTEQAATKPYGQDTPPGQAPMQPAPVSLEQGDEQAPDLIAQRLSEFATELAQRRSKFMEWRIQIGVEERWRNCIDVYYGRADPMDDHDLSPKWFERREPIRLERTPTRSSVRVNVTAGKTDAGQSRLQEILFPNDDQNWCLGPEPMPELDKLQGLQTQVFDANGQMLGTIADAIEQEREKERQQIEILEGEISTQLDLTDHAAHGRKQLQWAARLGTGILKGPINKTKRRSRMALIADHTGQPAGFMRATLEQVMPAEEVTDPRNWFPDPDAGNDYRNGCGTFERRQITRSGLRKLAKETRGYFPDAIKRVLDQPPMRVDPRPLPGQERASGYQTMTGESYELWEWRGEVAELDLAILLGLNGRADEVDTLQSLYACVYMVNDVVIGFEQYDDPEDCMCYHVFCWEEDPDIPFGRGLQEKQFTQQRIVNGAWRGTMDNLGVASRPMVALLKNKVKLAGGGNQIRGGSVFECDEIEDVRAAIEVHDVPTKIDDFLKLVQAAQDMGDKESNIPDIIQGIKGSAPEQVGSLLALLMKAEGVVRQLCADYDNRVTIPLIRGYVRWNRTYTEQFRDMQCEVKARGATVLFMREMRATLAQYLLNQSAANPNAAALVKLDAALEIVCRAAGIDPDEVLKSKSELAADQKAAQENPPPPPVPVQVQQLRNQGDMQKHQGRMEEIAAQGQVREKELAQELQIAQTDASVKVHATNTQSKTVMARDVLAHNHDRQMAVIDAAAAQQTGKMPPTPGTPSSSGVS